LKKKEPYAWGCELTGLHNMEKTTDASKTPFREGGKKIGGKRKIKVTGKGTK